MENKILRCPNCETEIKPFKLIFKNNQCNSCSAKFYIASKQNRYISFVGIFIGMLIGLMLVNGHYQSSAVLLSLVLLLFFTFRSKFESYEVTKIV